MPKAFVIIIIPLYSGVFAECAFGKSLLNGSLNLPRESNLPKTNTTFPHFFVADSAFPLKRNIMKPFPGKLLTEKKRIFNYRLSRARRVIENSFGILVARWRVLRATLNCFPENAEKITLAAIALHNFLQSTGTENNSYCPPNFADWEGPTGQLNRGQWRNETDGLNSVRLGSNNYSRAAFSLRDRLSTYFMEEGAIEFQRNRYNHAVRP